MGSQLINELVDASRSSGDGVGAAAVVLVRPDPVRRIAVAYHPLGDRPILRARSCPTVDEHDGQYPRRVDVVRARRECKHDPACQGEYEQNGARSTAQTNKMLVHVSPLL